MTKLYCKIVENQITAPNPLPDSYKTKDDVWITGFNHLSSEEVLIHGFYEFVMPNVNYDSDKKDIRYLENKLNSDNKTVSPEYEIVDKSPKELPTAILSAQDVKLIYSILSTSKKEVKSI